MTTEQKAAHLANLLKLASAHDAKKKAFGFTVIDVTPAGYGLARTLANCLN